MPSPSFLEMRRRNALAIVKIVRERKEISRADLAREADLAPATVSSIVDDLLGLGLLEETGAQISRRGRRPVGLKFNPGAAYAVGVSVEPGSAQALLCDLDGHAIGEETRELPGTAGTEQLAREIASIISSLARTHGADEKRVRTIGLAVPGPVSPLNREALEPNTPVDIVHYRDVADALERRLETPVVLDSNTNMAAYAECSQGAGKGFETVLFVRASHAVRSAFMVRGELVAGTRGLGGELGHLALPAREGLEERRTINSLASADSIVSSARQSGSKAACLDEVVARSGQGDAACQAALRSAGQAIGYGVSAAIDLLAPAAVILSGPIMAAGELVTAEIEAVLEAEALETNVRNCRLSLGRLISGGEAVGAALRALAIAPILPEDKRPRAVR